MPTIIPIRDLRNTSEISDMAHKIQEPIFVTKNGYSDLVVMSTELYEKIAQTNRIDQAIFEAEEEMNNGAEPKVFQVVTVYYYLREHIVISMIYIYTFLRHY